MDKAIQDALNEQINAELHSAYTYWAMSAHFSENDFDGFAHWMRRQAQEEMEHATKLYDYVLERGGHVVLTAVAAPSKKFGTPLQIFQTALGHEKKITALIHALYELARKKKDFATENHLNFGPREHVTQFGARCDRPVPHDVEPSVTQIHRPVGAGDRIADQFLAFRKAEVQGGEATVDEFRRASAWRSSIIPRQAR